MIPGQLYCSACDEWAFPGLFKWKHGRCEMVPTATPNAVNSAPAVVNAKKRGAYPDTDSRREYMRQKMAARRAAAKQGGA
jgi:hypothetical protein